MKQRFVLDAWALLALLQRQEPAASHVKELLEDADAGNIELLISVINLGEAVYHIGKLKGETEARDTLDHIRHLPLAVVSATDHAVFAAARFKMHHAISYADAFAAAAATELNAVLVTGDPELEQLRSQVQIEKLERGGPT